MAVPKKKKSSSRTRQGRAHHALQRQQIVEDKTTGELRLPHHMSPTDSYYNGRQIITKKDSE
jgi:large subunit ribosomal protein L32